MKSTAYVCIHTHLTEWFLATCMILGTVIEYIELDHTFAHNTTVYVCHLCIKKTFSDIN